MTKITSIDRPACEVIRQRLEKALSGCMDDVGLTVKVRNAVFDGSSVTFKVMVAVTGADGTVMTPEATAFKQLASLIGFKPEDLGREFKNGGRTYTIAGYKSRAKLSLIAKRDDGKMFKFPPDYVKALIGKEVK